MEKISLILGILLAVLAHPAMAEDGQRIARVCSADFGRLCAGRIPVPAVEDFKEGGLIYNCLQEHGQQLSLPCWYVITGGGK
jgi:hypothetical protein